MSNDDQNPETGASDWIDDVVNRALKVLTDLTRRLLPKRRDQKETEDKQNLAKSTETYLPYPYPDEDESVNLHDAPQANNEDGSARSVKKAIEWLVVIVGALLVAF